MIISENRKPTLSEFQELMKKTDKLLNEDAIRREDYYAKRSGKPLERDVYDAVNECAKNTEFEGTIQLISGAAFPDIVANKYYGIEVKSTEKNHWTSIGSSILESTRNASVERIFLTFGKLGKPVQFMSRPYEECLSGIAVTHYPRYQIDMRLKTGETIFDKMGVSYDELRMMENPVAPVSKYYKGKLKQGESLWWAANDVETSAPPTVKLWSTLSHEEKEQLTVQGYALFPEVLSAGNNKKYNRYALWLATQQGVINTNVRDGFSAGGKVLMNSKTGIQVSMPAAFGRIEKYHELIQAIIEETDESVLMEYWETESIDTNRMRQWCHLVANAAASSVGYSMAWSVLSTIFFFIGEENKESIYYNEPFSIYASNKVAETQNSYHVQKQCVRGISMIPAGASVNHVMFGRGRVIAIEVKFEKRAINLPYALDDVEAPFSILDDDTVYHEKYGTGKIYAIEIAFSKVSMKLSYPKELLKGLLFLE